MDDFDAAGPTPNYDVSTSLGLSVILKRPRLIASSKLDVNFAWYKDDAQVYTNNTHFVTSTGDLVIVGITRNDFGNYRLIASSESFTDIVSQEYSIKDVGDSNRPQMSEMAISIVYFTPDQTILASTLGKKEHFDCVPNTGKNVHISWLLDGKILSSSEVGVSMLHNNRRLVMTNPASFTKGEHKLECRIEATSGRIFEQKFSTINFIAPPILRPLPTETRRPIHSTIDLRCSMKKKSSPAIFTWYFNGQKLTGPATQNNHLKLSSIGQLNFGVYQCEAQNEAGRDSTSVWLHEGDPNEVLPAFSSHEDEDLSQDPLLSLSRDDPVDTVEKSESINSTTTLSFLKVPSDATIPSGSEKHSLFCSASGHPKPHMIWYFNDSEIHPATTKYDITDDALTIHDLKKSDSGIYTCEATNSMNTKTVSAKLSVTGDNLIEFGPVDQKSLIGTNVEFSCEVAKEFERTAQRTWYLNDELIPTMGDPGLRISKNRKGSLIIRQVGPDNIGEYRCSVRVEDRVENATANLRIIEKPAMPVAVKAELHNETMPAKVRISWLEGFDGNEPIIKHAVEMRTLGPTGLWSDWQTVIDNVAKDETKPCCSVDVEDLKPSQTAEFRVVASNKHGAGKPSLPSANVTMPQQPPSAAPRNVAASARSSNSVIVQWQQPKEEQWSGDILGYIVRYRLAGYSSLTWNEKNITTKDARNAVIDQLITWREYEIQVAAYNHRGLGVFSHSIEVTTAEGVPTQAPKGVRVHVLNSTAVQVYFTAPDQQRIPGVNLGYKVEFWKGIPLRGPLHRQVLLDPDRSQLETIVEGLEKFGHYNVTVLCYTAAGDGPRSHSISVVTEQDIPGPVSELTVAEVMFNGAVILWNMPLDPNGIITKYTIRHWPTSNSELKTELQINGDQKNVTIEGLESSTSYTMDISASTIKGEGPKEETKFESGVPPELPGRPSSLSITDVQARSVRLNFVPGFDGHTSIKQWIVEARIAESTIFTHIFSISAPKARSIAVEGLRPYTQYQLRLVAENVKGRGAPSEPSQAFETKQTNPEMLSAKMFADPISATAISVSWTPLLANQWNGQPKGYLIVYKEDNTDDWKEVRTPSLRASEYTIRDLRPYTNYQIELFAENIFGRSETSETLQAKTYESVPSGSPRNVLASLDGPRSIIVKWEPVHASQASGIILGYTVRVAPEREGQAQEETKTVDAPDHDMHSVKVTGLRAYSGYRVFVSAYTIVGNGPENTVATLVDTGEDLPGPPQYFGCSFVSENEVRLKWLPPAYPNGKIQSYVVSYWRATETRSSAIDAQVAGSLLMFSATSLQPAEQYFFAVKAANPTGESDENIIEVVTSSVRVPLRNPPNPLRDDKTPYSSNKIGVTWKETHPNDPEAPVRAVQVAYQKANDDNWTPIERVDFAKGSAVATSLSPNSAYRFRIRYIGDFTESVWSAESDWMRTLPAAPSAAPSSIQPSPYDSSSLQLTWTVPDRKDWNANEIGYRIAYREYPSNDTWSVAEIPSGSEHSDREQYVLQKLASFRHYIVKMRAFNSEGEGPFSQPVFVYIGYSIPKRNISHLTAEPVSSNVIHIRWNPWTEDASDVISGFKIRFVPVASILSPESKEEELMVVETNSANLTDLRKFTEYQISVSAYNRAGEGNMAQLRVRTLEDVPGPVEKLRFRNALLDSVRVVWEPPSQPNGKITGYIVNYRASRVQEDFKREEQHRTSETYFDARNLEENTQYYFIVWAETAAGRGEPETGNITVGVNPEGPLPPSRPVVIPAQSYITLQWRDNQIEDLVGHLVQAKRIARAVQPNSEQNSGRSTVQPEKRRLEREVSQINHPIGEWVTLQVSDGLRHSAQISYHDLEPASFYVFRVFARNELGVGKPSVDSEQLYVPESIPEEPFYTKWWFLALVAMGAFVCVVVIIAILCVTGKLIE
ncbi:hypothetical protein WR25_09019 [Diploscapter pachys]|uniref:Uncharacterized protein n=1 Tax=Diploscapter pachys TaxID=2018661 RepID=A0A2A2M198_9BILA|nr:hypothetical protein WR25_09019 [Diploscapter pachys]